MTAPFLRLLPAALLFWSVPPLFGALWLIVQFRRIAETGAGDAAMTMRLSAGVAGLLWLGTLVLLTVTVALMRWERRLRIEAESAEAAASPDANPGGSASQAPSWHAAVLVASSLLMIPAGLTMWSASSSTRLVASAVMAISDAEALGTQQEMDLGPITRVISARLIIATGLGGFTSVTLVGFIFVNLLLIQPAPGVRLLPRYSRVAAGLVTAAAAIALISIGAHLVRLFRA
jgi:hypothetical protein